MFNSKKIKELQEQVAKLEDEVYKLQHPFRYEIGDTVTYTHGVNGKILDRHWEYRNKYYSLLINDKLKKDVYEGNLSKWTYWKK